MTKNVLVTGGNGYLGLHIILQLLNQGYHVRATLRQLDKQTTVRTALKENQAQHRENLSFVAADLTQDAGWATAMQNIDYVLSVASPVFSNDPNSDTTATEGILRILKAAQQAHVKRVVMTANFGAIGFSNHDQTSITTEADWTDPNEKGLSAYEKFKLIAEQAAWQFIEQSHDSLELTTINPVAIMGPALDAHVSGSFDLLKNLLNGRPKMIPNIPLNLIDVRDVADLHIRALTAPHAGGQRFLASAAGQISLPEIAALIRQKRPQITQNIPTKTMPNLLLSSAALFNQTAREGNLLVHVNRQLSTQKAQDILKWQPHFDNTTIVLDSIDTLIQYGLLP